VTFGVVLVDDGQDLRGVWRILLECSPGFDVVGQAGDGWEALALCRERRPDAVVTDWRMPGLDGLGLVRRLRADHPDTVVVLCSGYPRGDLAPEPDDPGVAYLNKMDSGQLPELLTRLLTSRRSDTSMTIPQSRRRLQRYREREQSHAVPSRRRASPKR
jgi:DNA-binding NarL/FixJ family response regulator